MPFPAALKAKQVCCWKVLVSWVHVPLAGVLGSRRWGNACCLKRCSASPEGSCQQLLQQLAPDAGGSWEENGAGTEEAGKAIGTGWVAEN